MTRKKTIRIVPANLRVVTEQAERDELAEINFQYAEQLEELRQRMERDDDDGETLAHDWEKRKEEAVQQYERLLLEREEEMREVMRQLREDKRDRDQQDASGGRPIRERMPRDPGYQGPVAIPGMGGRGAGRAVRGRRPGFTLEQNGIHRDDTRIMIKNGFVDLCKATGIPMGGEEFDYAYYAITARTHTAIVQQRTDKAMKEGKPRAAYDVDDIYAQLHRMWVEGRFTQVRPVIGDPRTYTLKRPGKLTPEEKADAQHKISVRHGYVREGRGEMPPYTHDKRAGTHFKPKREPATDKRKRKGVAKMDPYSGSLLPRTGGGGSQENLFCMCLGRINEAKRVDNARLNALHVGKEYRVIHAALAEQSRQYARCYQILVDAFAQDVRLGSRYLLWCSRCIDLHTGNVWESPYQHEPIMGVEPLVPRTIGGGGDRVPPCAKSVAACALHYHSAREEGAGGEQALKGAERRIAEKVKLCKVSKLQKCDGGAECLINFPKWEHFHLSARQKVLSDPRVVEQSPYGMSATEAADLADAERLAGYGDADDDDAGSVMTMEEEFETLLPRHLGGNREYYRWCRASMYGSTKERGVWYDLDRRARSHMLGKRIGGTVDGCFQAATNGRDYGFEFQRKPTSGKNLQCFYTALANGKYEGGQALKDQIEEHPRMTQFLHKKFFSEQHLRGGDELLPFAAEILGKSIIVLSEQGFTFAPYGNTELSACLILYHEGGGVGHFEECIFDSFVSHSRRLDQYLREFQLPLTDDTGDEGDDAQLQMAIKASMSSSEHNNVPSNDEVHGDERITGAHAADLAAKVRAGALAAQARVASSLAEEEASSCASPNGGGMGPTSPSGSGSSPSPPGGSGSSASPPGGSGPPLGPNGSNVPPSTGPKSPVSINNVPPKGEANGGGGAERLTLADMSTGLSSVISTRNEILVEACGHVRVRLGAKGYAYYKRELFLNFTSRFTRYDSVLQEYSGDILSENYDIVAEGAELFVSNVNGRGHYRPGTNRVVGTGPLFRVEAVTLARSHEWLRNFRIAAMNLVNTVSFGSVYNRNTLYRGLTKERGDLIVCKEVLAYLKRSKITTSHGVMQGRHVGSPIYEAFLGVPFEMITDTLIYFAEQRCSTQSMLKGTNDALEGYLKMDTQFRKQHVNPSGWQAITDIANNSAAAGVYRLIGGGEAAEQHRNGLTCITRESYVPSAPAHGSARDPVYDAGNKYELVTAATGCGFLDPYPFFRTQANSQKEQYQSVGGCFATKGQVVESSPREVELCALRMTMSRPNEQDLRAAQRTAYASAYEHACAELPGVNEEITRHCVRYDSKYVAPAVEHIPAPTNLQRLMDIWCTARRDAHLPEFEEHVQGSFVSRMFKYITDLGVKKAQRYSALGTYCDEPNQEKRGDQVIAGGQKPHEIQKLKKGVLKYARMVAAMQGQSWIKSDPTMMKALKHLDEIPIVVEGNTLKCDGREYPLGFTMRDVWYRGILSDTNLDELNLAYEDMVSWLHNHPGGLAAASHGDDQIYCEIVDGVDVWSETDIVLNDGSHTDVSFRLSALNAAAHGFEQAAGAFAQLSRPIVLRNPVAYNEKVVVRSLDGMNQASGHGGTTHTNTEESGKIPFATALLNKGFVDGAASIGYLVELAGEKRPLHEVTFLSKCAARWRDGRIRCFTELASLLRGLGRVTGDVIGSSKLCVEERWKEHVLGVAKGWVNEPDSVLMAELRRICGLPCTHRLQKEAQIQELGEQDWIYVSRYYSDVARGCEEYLHLISELRGLDHLYGNIVVSPFIDTVMRKRYGMEGCCK